MGADDVDGTDALAVTEDRSTAPGPDVGWAETSSFPSASAAAPGPPDGATGVGEGAGAEGRRTGALSGPMHEWHPVRPRVLFS